MQSINDYSIDYHKHIFSAWCACTASRASNKCRFTVDDGVQVLNKLEIERLAKEIPSFKTDKIFDAWHDKQCIRLVELAKKRIEGFTYGVAAKMFNCYLKAYFLDHLNSFQFIHPPIDRLLLSDLEKRNFDEKKKIWRKYKNIGWSNFSREEYQEVIQHIKLSLHPEKALWKIEFYWQGHQ